MIKGAAVKSDTIRVMPWLPETAVEPEPLLTREWLATNGLGGYASGSVSGIPTRRYHGLLIAALPAPFGRMLMLNSLAERVRMPDGSLIRLGGHEGTASLKVHAAGSLAEFRLETGLPVWRYKVGPYVLEKRIFLPHHQNTSYIVYKLLSGADDAVLLLRPSLNVRPHEGRVNAPIVAPYSLRIEDGRYEIHPGPDLPPLRLAVRGDRSMMIVAPKILRSLRYRIEGSRGYEDSGDLWSPGAFRLRLRRNRPAALIASVEPWPTVLAMSPQDAEGAEQDRRRRLIAVAPAVAQTGPAAELVLAADQFLIEPAGRMEDAARARASGDEARTVIAGYHWFTDWGRDTMISLEGLTLATGRHREAGSILRTFAHYVRDGLIPNFFPDGENEGLYHTADATLWFFHAMDRYLEVVGDRDPLRVILPKLTEIVRHHLRGTRFGIGVDPTDGLLRQGAEGYQLTWMDAKVDGWVVTPRRGKAVEINALWYNAIRLLEGWLREEGRPDEADELARQADQTFESFNRRFWSPSHGHLFDVVDGENGDDPACRPNQLLAISLKHPVLERRHWEAVFETAERQLLTPVGLRSLAPGHPDYKPKYYGDLRARDAAYHQGTVWGWLIGPYIDARLKLHPDDHAGARARLQGIIDHLGEAGLGSVSEIFDAEEPFTPRGCIAQAWSVAEALRCWVKTAEPKPS